MSINIMELSQMMQDKTVVQKDMEEAMQLVQNLFKEKYVSKMQKAIETQHKKASVNPPKEVQLMQAMKQFLPESKHKPIEQMINAMILLDTAKNIQTELKPTAKPPQHFAAKSYTATNLNDSIHEDGIYDIDHTCLRDKNNIPCVTPPNMLALFVLLNML